MPRTVVAFAICALTVFSCFATGCAKRQRVDESPVVRAYRLIDAQRSQEAILLLEELLQEEPENDEYRRALASAYAHLAGIKIQKLVPVVRDMKSLSKFAEAFKFEKSNSDVSSAKVDQTVLNIEKMLTKLGAFFGVYAKIPKVAKKNSTFLIHAIELMSSIGERTPSDSLYRAVLQIILFKYIVAEDLLAELTEKDVNKSGCRLDVSRFNTVASQLGNLLLEIIDDFGRANPKQKEKLAASRSSIVESISSLTLVSTSIMVLDEASDLFIKKSLVDLGFGKLVKCDGPAE